jgi:hypothetical protein
MNNIKKHYKKSFLIPSVLIMLLFLFLPAQHAAVLRITETKYFTE